MSWTERAACHGKNATFFPTEGGKTAEARAICAVCPVREECLEHAITNGIWHGVWGGLGGSDRRKLVRGQTVTEHRPPGRPQTIFTECLWADSSNCGTTWGYLKGCHGDHCVAAERQRSRERRQKKKVQAHGQEHEDLCSADAARTS